MAENIAHDQKSVSNISKGVNKRMTEKECQTVKWKLNCFKSQR